ncbi:hypothetical protein GUM66_002486 [Salmonella enterica]|nr:hypothetical protein [Salmonella enterica]EDS3401921.1 hypothetical protein [Salmonella enterica]EDW3549534.1 hypothetical protein [Salmonella enterica]EDZ6266569.1 hypothetical protein [Salmonella enterica]EDZ6465447.1 hypothetical protein [Salmonella enterica]
MRGNSLVRFLGGGGAVMRCCYPTLPTPCILQAADALAAFVNPSHLLE